MPLNGQIMAPIPKKVRDATVTDMVDSNGQWEWTKLSNLNHYSMLPLADIFFPRNDSDEDLVIWNKSASGLFPTSSAYTHLEEDQLGSKDCLWDNVWKWEGPQRIETFLWRAAHGRLFTNFARYCRNMKEDPSCHCCPGLEESVSHVLRDCNQAKRVWYLLVGRDKWRGFQAGPMATWISNNLRRGYGEQWQQDWFLFFGVAAWHIWLRRNECIFNNG